MKQQQQQKASIWQSIDFKIKNNETTKLERIGWNRMTMMKRLSSWLQFDENNEQHNKQEQQRESVTLRLPFIWYLFLKKFAIYVLPYPK